ncbi:hypothetical protein PR048_005856 [Dryococelus australis]|uniref:Uncharacterized protein n=1 Tax=Dryococelus australis TaxID=614101 RepID=A0ABQ9I9B7_9NEOP|nr:hypothetical protein PR048_005856 [Dryococelus australis]
MAGQAEPVAGPSTASVTFSPYDIPPPPNRCKRGKTSRWRQTKCSSQILTSSPYEWEVYLKGRASNKKAKVPTKKWDKQSETSKRVKIFKRSHYIESTFSYNSSIAVQLINSGDDDLPTKEHQPYDTNFECIFCTSKFCDDVKGEE